MSNGINMYETALFDNKQCPISITLTQRRLCWFGHLHRMPPKSEVLKLHNFSPGTIDWMRPRGRPRRRWLDCVSQDLAVIDLPLAEAVHVAHHRIAWRAVLHFVTSMLDNQQELTILCPIQMISIRLTIHEYYVI